MSTEFKKKVIGSARRSSRKRTLTTTRRRASTPTKKTQKKSKKLKHEELKADLIDVSKVDVESGGKNDLELVPEPESTLDSIVPEPEPTLDSIIPEPEPSTTTIMNPIDEDDSPTRELFGFSPSKFLYELNNNSFEAFTTAIDQLETQLLQQSLKSSSFKDSDEIQTADNNIKAAFDSLAKYILDTYSQRFQVFKRFTSKAILCVPPDLIMTTEKDENKISQKKSDEGKEEEEEAILDQKITEISNKIISARIVEQTCQQEIEAINEILTQYTQLSTLFNKLSSALSSKDVQNVLRLSLELKEEDNRLQELTKELNLPQAATDSAGNSDNVHTMESTFQLDSTSFSGSLGDMSTFANNF